MCAVFSIKTLPFLVPSLRRIAQRLILLSIKYITVFAVKHSNFTRARLIFLFSAYKISPQTDTSFFSKENAMLCGGKLCILRTKITCSAIHHNGK